MELNEQIKRIKEMMGLNEALSDTVYHFTNQKALINILKTDKFVATGAIGSSADIDINRGKYFYMSTTRSKSTGFVKGNVKLVLDGRRLNQRYKGVAVDYWQYPKNPEYYGDEVSYKNALLGGEQEDRIITDKPYIDNAISYIKEIHILIGGLDSIYKSDLDFIKTLSAQKNIGLYFYDNRNNWLYQTKPVDPEKTYWRMMHDSEERYEKTENDGQEWFRAGVLYLYKNEDKYNTVLNILGDQYADKFKEFYQQEMQRRFYGDIRSDYDLFNLYSNNIAQIRADQDPISRQLLKLLADDMRKLGVKRVGDYIKKKYMSQIKPPTDYKTQFMNYLYGQLEQTLNEYYDNFRLGDESVEINGEYQRVSDTPEISEFLQGYMNLIYKEVKEFLDSVDPKDVTFYYEYRLPDVLDAKINVDSIDIQKALNLDRDSLNQRVQNIISLMKDVPTSGKVKYKLSDIWGEYEKQFKG